MNKTITYKVADLTPMERVRLARAMQRPRIEEYIEYLCSDFFLQQGDLLGKEDSSIMGGIGMFHGRPITIIGHKKGTDMDSSVKCNFGMPGPEGYRKALRLMKQAEKFNRPIVTFIDTPGAYPGIEAEAGGQSQAIAKNLAEMSSLKVPVIAIVTGEGSSGGALAIGVANKVFMLENAVYSILSPEGFASILWKDAEKKEEAAKVMHLTSMDLLELGVIDGIIPEEKGGAQMHRAQVFADIDALLLKELKALSKKSGADLAADRYKKFREMDKIYLEENAEEKE